MRLGYVNYETLKKMAGGGVVRGLRIAPGAKLAMCTVSAPTKTTRQSIPRARSSPDEVADGGCHIDLTGPNSFSIGGYRYCTVDVWRDFVQTYAIKRKNEAPGMVKRFLTMIEL